MSLPTTDWTATLDRIGAAVGRILGDLERYQREWAPLTDSPAAATTPELLLGWLERRLNQWDERLTAAGEVAAAVERQLDDREAAVGRWHEVFRHWQELLQRGVDPAGPTPLPPAGSASSAG